MMVHVSDWLAIDPTAIRGLHFESRRYFAGPEPTLVVSLAHGAWHRIREREGGNLGALKNRFDAARAAQGDST